MRSINKTRPLAEYTSRATWQEANPLISVTARVVRPQSTCVPFGITRFSSIDLTAKERSVLSLTNISPGRPWVLGARLDFAAADAVPKGLIRIGATGVVWAGTLRNASSCRSTSAAPTGGLGSCGAPGLTGRTSVLVTSWCESSASPAYLSGGPELPVEGAGNTSFSSGWPLCAGVLAGSGMAGRGLYTPWQSTRMGAPLASVTGRRLVLSSTVVSPQTVSGVAVLRTAGTIAGGASAPGCDSKDAGCTIVGGEMSKFGALRTGSSAESLLLGYSSFRFVANGKDVFTQKAAPNRMSASMAARSVTSQIGNAFSVAPIALMSSGGGSRPRPCAGAGLDGSSFISSFGWLA